jgi:nucleotide-binding universal stress UspA family protein
MRTIGAPPRIQLKNILFTTDFSLAAAAALPYAGELAKHYGAKLYVLHVRTPVINPMTPPAGWPALEKAAEAEERERRETLRNAIPGIEPTVLIEDGDLWTNVKSIVDKKSIDLIVMGTRGLTGVGKLLLGSAAEEIFSRRDLPGTHGRPPFTGRTETRGRSHQDTLRHEFRRFAPGCGVCDIPRAGVSGAPDVAPRD